MIKAFAAGFLISIGCKVYLMEGQFFGAVLFSLALLCIIKYNLPLFTGRVGYPNSWVWLVYILVFNLLGSMTGGLLFESQWPVETVLQRCESPLWKVFIRGTGCGILMYIAVDYGKKSPFITIMSIATFILAGFDHCIADMAYLANKLTYYTPWYIPVVILGNAVGSKLAYYCMGALENDVTGAEIRNGGACRGQPTGDSESSSSVECQPSSVETVPALAGAYTGNEQNVSKIDCRCKTVCGSIGERETESASINRKCWEHFLERIRGSTDW